MVQMHTKRIIYFIQLTSLWIFSAVSQQSNETSISDPVDFTVVSDSTLNKAKKSKDGLPLDVDVTFDVLDRKVSLSLKRNPKATSAKDVFVIRMSDHGIPVVIPYSLNENEVYGEYQDIKNGAIFTLSCPKQNSSTGKCDTTMEGTFRLGREEFRLSPMDETSFSRVKRNSNDLLRKAKTIATAATASSKIYGIYKTKQLPGTPTDFKDEAPLIRGRIEAAFGKEAKTVRESVLPGGRMYNLEILAVLDYGIYERFYKASRLGTEWAKDNEAKNNMKKYFSHVFNGVDMLYQTIDDPEFTLSVAVSGFIIADSPDVSPWTTPHINRNPGGRHDLLVSVPLDELLRWTFSARNLPENDHIMLLTDYDLYSVDRGRADKRTAGYARVGSVCSMDSVSVIEDHGGFQSINAAAHELGHGLGSRHDGRMNSCDPDDQYIMTAHGGFETAKTKGNPWRFSRCSVAYFKDYISRLPRRHCLTDPVDVFDREEYLKFVSTYPGQDYSPNEQCQDILGLDSYYGWGPELGKFSDICTEMSCKVPGASRSYRVYKAATGTSCGDKKWCMEGQCVFDEKAPSKVPSCVFGDIQRRFGTSEKSCRQYMLDNPMRCYDSFYSTRCCDTCDRLDTGVKGCEYGDKYLNCRASGCFDPSYARDCCSTCGLAPHPIIRTAPATTSTERSPTTSAKRATGKPLTPRHTTRRSWTPKTQPTTKKPWTPKTQPTTRKPWTPKTQPTTRKPWTTRHTTRKTWTHVPIPTRRPTRKTTTSVAAIKPASSSGLCLREDSRFLLVFRCSSLPSVFGENACDNSFVARYCCDRCPEPGQKGCVDTPKCQVQYARQCYSQQSKDECCRTCRRFETGRKGCEYGDKIRSCERYVGELGISLVCSRYKDYCCEICNALATNNLNNTVKLTDRESSGAVTKIGQIGPTLPPVSSKNKGKQKSRKDSDKQKKNKITKNNAEKGHTNTKDNNPNQIPFTKFSARLGDNDSTIKTNKLSEIPGRVVHRIVFRPVRRRERFNMFRQSSRPGQQDSILKRLNLIISSHRF